MTLLQEVQTPSVRERALEKLRRDLGLELSEALRDPKTVEVMLNPDGLLWQERLGEKMHCIGKMTAPRAESIIKTIAGFHQKEVTRYKPLIEGEFPLDGSRFAGQLPPIVPSPCFAIRKRAVLTYSLDDYLTTGILGKAHAVAIQDAVASHKNILVVGGTGSGKTTLVNAIIQEMVKTSPEERVFILEDTGEIQCTAKNHVQYHTSLDVSMTDLLKATLRMRPDRILVGEVRGAEALDLLDAWNTGHQGGVATLHANSALAGLYRLKSLIGRNAFAPKDIEPLIAEAVDMVIFISRTPKGRKVQEVLDVHAFEDGVFHIQSH